MPIPSSPHPPHSAADAVPPIVDAPWLIARQGDPRLRILDLRDRPSYDAGHLPGAVWFERTAFSIARTDHSVILAPGPVFARLMGRLGIAAETTVVVYDDVWGMHAARLAWALRRFGHRLAAVLSGGAEGWQAVGQALTCGATLAFPRSFPLSSDESQYADLSWLRVRTGDRGVLLLDVRGAHEYAAGHLPGARNWEWSRGTPTGSWAMTRPPEELHADLRRYGISPDRRIVTYCTSGMRAAHTCLLLRSLGYPDVRVLDAAWRAIALPG